MAGRPITNHTRRAQLKREAMRSLRESRKVRPVPINHVPLVAAINHWRTS